MTGLLQHRRWWLPLVAYALLSACKPESDLPKSQVFILVDLSLTWHNDRNLDRSRKVLSEIGYGVAMAANDYEQPVAIQTRIIGSGSLEREPECDVVYRSSFVNTKAKADYEINKLKNLEQFLGVDCVNTLLAKSPEMDTEISASLISIANSPLPQSGRRDVVIASDFLEDADAPINLPDDMKAFHVLMLFRPLTEDMKVPATMQTRVAQWKQAMIDRGATVVALPDTALKRATVSSFLKGTSG